MIGRFARCIECCAPACCLDCIGTTVAVFVWLKPVDGDLNETLGSEDRVWKYLTTRHLTRV